MKLRIPPPGTNARFVFGIVVLILIALAFLILMSLIFGNGPPYDG